MRHTAERAQPSSNSVRVQSAVAWRRNPAAHVIVGMHADLDRDQPCASRQTEFGARLYTALAALLCIAPYGDCVCSVE